MKFKAKHNLKIEREGDQDAAISAGNILVLEHFRIANDTSYHAFQFNGTLLYIEDSLVEKHFAQVQERAGGWEVETM